MPSKEIRDRLLSGLPKIPEYVSLTPVRGKRPYRKGWQTEAPLSRDELIRILTHGDRQWSEKQRYWNAYPDGYGFRFGGEFLGIDVDGCNAERIFTDLSGGNIPETVSWASGKPGRRGLVYKIPESLQRRLQNISFTHLAVFESTNVERSGNEQLDFRYDRCQSVLPPSCHPETGAYHWINSFEACEISPAPSWLEDFLFAHCDRIHEEIKEREWEDLYRSRLYEDSDLTSLVDLALSFIPPRSIGSGNYAEWQRIIPAVIDAVGETEAERLIEKHSPSLKGTSWKVGYKIQSFSRGFGRGGKGITVATLFHIAKQYGFTFPDRKGFEFPSVTATSATTKAEVELTGRERLISKRLFRFFDYWEGLKRDFSLSPVIQSVDSQIEYTGRCPKLELGFYDTLAVSGWLGAGKTHAVIESLTQFKDKAIAWSAPSNGLCRQSAERAKKAGFITYHYQDDVTLHRQQLKANEAGIYFACPDSFKKYAFEDAKWESKIFVIDEFSGIRKALSNKSEQEYFFNAIAKCGLLIIADAFLSDADLALLSKIRSGGVLLYRQKFEKSSVPICWIETRNQVDEISFCHDGIYLNLIQCWIEKGISKIAIAVDSIAYAKTLKLFIEETFEDKKVWLSCSETVEENHIFMPNPDRILAEKEIDILIYTPTAKSGLDVQSHFDRGLLICCGVLPPTEMLQMMGRCRQCKKWYVSAPRRSFNPACTTPSLDGKKVRAWADQITKTFEELEFNTLSTLQGWGLWESLTKDIEKAFNSEYVYTLLNEYFSDVTTHEIESASLANWKDTNERVKLDDAENTLNADLEAGLKVIQKQQQPSNNSQVWDVKLAELYIRYPKIVERLKEDLSEGAIDFIRTLSSRRIEKIKNWVTAIDENPQDDADLLKVLQSRRTNYNSNTFKLLQRLKLFRKLKLRELAKFAGRQLKKEHINVMCFNPQSPQILQRWKVFQESGELKKLYPLVNSIFDFWQVVRSVMAYFGYQSLSTKQRVETTELHPNGRFRGIQRYTNSKTENFIAWIIMEASGAVFFQANFELIIEAIRDRLEAERVERKKWQEEYLTAPPDEAKRAA